MNINKTILLIFMFSFMITSTLFVSSTALAQPDNDCVDESSEKSSKKKRRRPGGSNRDCKVAEVKVNLETGDVEIVK
ncbi:MAG: hypothetical protein L3J83_00675 [Proteobacteria bacterium]|nr:hypothetical protein [Pseudomonadota bacterium]